MAENIDFIITPDIIQTKKMLFLLLNFYSATEPIWVFIDKRFGNKTFKLIGHINTSYKTMRYFIFEGMDQN